MKVGDRVIDPEQEWPAEGVVVAVHDGVVDVEWQTDYLVEVAIPIGDLANI